MQHDTLKRSTTLGVELGSSAKIVRQAYLDLLSRWDPETHV